MPLSPKPNRHEIACITSPPTSPPSTPSPDRWASVSHLNQEIVYTPLDGRVMLVTMPGGYNSGRPYVLMTNEKVPSRPPINPLTHPHNLQGGHIVYFRTYLALRLLCIARKVLCFALLVHWGMKLKEWLHLAGKLPAAADPE